MFQIVDCLKKLRMGKSRRELKKRQSEEAVEEVQIKLRMMKEHLTIHMIEIERICPSLLAGRRGEEEDLKGLCDSIHKYGLLQPLTVRRVCKDETSLGGIFTLIAGHRRLAALKLLGIKKAPCIIVDLPASSAAAAAASARIHQRAVDLFETAEYAAQMTEEHGISLEKASERLSLQKTAAKELAFLADFDAEEVSAARSVDLDRQLLCAIGRESDRLLRKKKLNKAVGTILALREQNAAGKPILRRRMLFTDMTPLCNSVKKLVETMQKAGVPAVWEANDGTRSFDIHIRVEKRPKREIQLPNSEIHGELRTDDPAISNF